jgi:hypothetical protein
MTDGFGSALPSAARCVATVLVARKLAVCWHEAAHFTVARSLGYVALIDVSSSQPSVSVSMNEKSGVTLSSSHSRLIRHAGWVASVAVAYASIALCSWNLRLEPWTAAAGSHEEQAHVQPAGGMGVLELDLTAAAFVFVALEAVYSDVLSSERPLGRFFCGNFGLLLLSQASSKRVKHLLRRMLATTVMRGAQSAGLVTYRKTRGIRHRAGACRCSDHRAGPAVLALLSLPS